MNSRIIIKESIEELSGEFGKLLAEKVNFAPGKFNLALSGGSTPKSVFKFLSENFKNKIDWTKINFFWGDERCVSPEDSESNFRMAKDNLFDKIGIPAENVFRIRGEDNPDDEANRYSGLISKLLPRQEKLPRFNLVMLGLGEDGHTASIFPDQIDLFGSDKICTVAEHPVTKKKRITLTGRVINNSESIILIVTGENKRKILKSILDNEPGFEKYPASHINPRRGKTIWLIDRAAAG